MTTFTVSVKEKFPTVQEPPGSYHNNELLVLRTQLMHAAIKVQRHMGLGVSPATFRLALAKELQALGLICQTQVMVPIPYKTHLLHDCEYLDLVVLDTLGLLISEGMQPDELQHQKARFLLKHCSLAGLLLMDIAYPLFEKSIIFMTSKEE